MNHQALFEMTAADYHASDAVGNSMLSSLKSSPAHCWAMHLNPNRPERKPTEAMRLGTLTHTAILEPDQVRHRYSIKPSDLNLNSNAGKEWKSAMVGLEIITADELLMVEEQRKAVQANDELRAILSSGHAEQSVFATDKATGLRIKCRPDWLQFVGPNRVKVFDLKTTADITLDAVSRSIDSFGYHRQQAHYTRVLEAAGLIVDDFIFGFVTKSYPFFAIPYRIDDESLAQGFEEVGELLSLYSHCLRENKWPLSGSGVQTVGLPRWARRETEIEVSYAT